MRTRLIVGAAIASVGLALTGCAVGLEQPIAPESMETEVVAPVTMSVHELQGATVELVTGQALNIHTDELNVESFTGRVSDESVLEFSAGHDDGSAKFNPGVLAVAPGTADVSLVDSREGGSPIEFTVTVSPRS